MIYNINGEALTERKLSDIQLTSANRYSAVGTGVQSAFITPNGKVWMVKANANCIVVDNGTEVATITLDHAVGHANNSNYDNGYAYVSDWTDGTVIHVFAVDETNNTMTWEKDITVPTTYGRTDYFVFDNEKQIISLGWNYEQYGNSQYAVLELWKLDKEGTYVKAWETVVNDITVLQGFCVLDDKAYIVNNSSSYKHIGIVIVDLKTGIQISDNSQTGTILTVETESITPIGENAFVVVTYNGAQFTLTES